MEEYGKIMMILRLILLYYIGMNLLLFFAMGADKFFAKKNMWRIPEKTLFSLALAGGAIGGFAGMSAFHHKTMKPIFKVIFLLGLIIHGVILYLFAKSILI